MTSTPLPTYTAINTTLNPTIEDPIMVAIREKLSAKLKTGFVELIPKEVFDKMTDLAIDEFVHGSKLKRYVRVSEWMDITNPNNPTGKSGHIDVFKPDPKYNVVMDGNTLPGMIYLEIVKLAKENISKTINEDPQFKETYDQNVGHMIAPVISKIVEDNAAAFTRGLMTNIVNYTMMSAVNSMRQSNGMGNYIPTIPVPPM